jgi:DNA-binding MarR family transcriptional regulator
MRISKDLLPAAVAVEAFEGRYGKFFRAVELASGKAGLSPNELEVLDALELAALSQAEMRSVLLVDRGQLSRCIKGMIAKGLVELRPFQKSLQTARYSISDLGETKLKFARRNRLAVIRRLLRLPKPARLQHLHKAVTQLAEALDPKSLEHNFDQCRLAEPTELPGIVTAIEADCLAKPRPFDFDNRVGAFIMRELGAIASSRNCTIIVNEWFSAYAGVALMIIDKKTNNVHFPLIWVPRF